MLQHYQYISSSSSKLAKANLTSIAMIALTCTCAQHTHAHTYTQDKLEQLKALKHLSLNDLARSNSGTPCRKFAPTIAERQNL
jgi:hypothetical protein